MKIAFLGDISLNDYYNKLYENNVNPFHEINNVLNRCDYVVGNLECGCRGNRISDKPLPTLSTDCNTLNFLTKIPVNVVTLSNNHIGDNYEEGFINTITKLKELHIQYLGAGLTLNDSNKPLIINNSSYNIVLLNYYGKDFEKSVPPDCEIYLNTYDKSRIINEIKDLKVNNKHIVLLFHWGAKIEGGYFPAFYQFRDSQDFIDAGASLIIGHHSHTFQPYEKINNSFVFYSLGNFCFSDYLFNGRVSKVDNYRGYKSGIPIFEFSELSLSLNQIVYFKNNIESIKIIRRQPFRYKINQIALPLLKLKSVWLIYFYYLRRIDWIFKYFFRSGRSLSDIIKDLNPQRIKRGYLKIFAKKKNVVHQIIS
jgi:hypothetical protein